MAAGVVTALEPRRFPLRSPRDVLAPGSTRRPPGRGARRRRCGGDAAPRPTGGKTAFRRVPDAGGSGPGDPCAWRESLADRGDPYGVGETAPLRRWERLQAAFRTDAAPWPHRAASPPHPRRCAARGDRGGGRSDRPRIPNPSRNVLRSRATATSSITVLSSPSAPCRCAASALKSASARMICSRLFTSRWRISGCSRWMRPYCAWIRSRGPATPDRHRARGAAPLRARSRRNRSRARVWNRFRR